MVLKDPNSIVNLSGQVFTESVGMAALAFGTIPPPHPVPLRANDVVLHKCGLKLNTFRVTHATTLSIASAIFWAIQSHMDNLASR